MRSILRLKMLAAVVGLSLAWNDAVIAQGRGRAQTPPPPARAGTGPAKTSAKSVAELTAEGYRDLIVNTADAMSEIGTYGQITPGAGSENVDGRQVECIMTFTFTESAAGYRAKRRKAWADVRVPKALAASHAEISKWMRSAETMAKAAPKCFLPMMQSSAAQLGFLSLLGGYDDLRKNATTALAGMGVTLPPIEKPTVEKK